MLRCGKEGAGTEAVADGAGIYEPIAAEATGRDLAGFREALNVVAGHANAVRGVSC
jgi:hypothetical protein